MNKINLINLHLCSSNLNFASSGSFTLASDHNLSAITLALGHSLDSFQKLYKIICLSINSN